ncbi:MAG: beta-ketoacyl-ACP reductase [Acidimicrobiia bacterium]|nr:beta-ketoacyl-ACP reductase [Acidimicrobiia bacterium]
MTSRVAFVTGASRGIGRATAVALAQEGHSVAFCWTQDEDGAAITVAAIEALGGSAMSLQTDVGNPQAIDEVFTSIENDFGPVEILVNNAGITRDGLLPRMSDGDWDSVMQVNLTGPFQTIRRAVPKMMRARYGRIVNVSSIAGFMGQAGQTNYAAAKSGLLGLTRSVAREYGKRGITCNVVAPGAILTSLTEAMGQEWLTGISALVPLARPGLPEECAATIAFLCSEPAGYISGALIPVDGGLSMGT